MTQTRCGLWLIVACAPFDRKQESVPLPLSTTPAMAARRLPTRSRAPAINTRPHSSIARAKSAVPTVMSPTTEEHPEHAFAIASSMKSTRSQAQDDTETHIQVAIRCRRRSDREMQENSPIIVSSNGAKSQEITIETSTPVSSLGIITLPPTRTYPFDLVFGPEADQAMIYHDVVSPMLDEVLMGYNCTLFAYGQTGTGKTFVVFWSFVSLCLT